MNNAALAAEAFCRDGAARVVVLDVDFHHGNGTQAIFYGRDDVFFLSLHGDPMDSFPYFLGGADETAKARERDLTKTIPCPRKRLLPRGIKHCKTPCYALKTTPPMH